jgi:hypothetical protein
MKNNRRERLEKRVAFTRGGPFSMEKRRIG